MLRKLWHLPPAIVSIALRCAMVFCSVLCFAMRLCAVLSWAASCCVLLHRAFVRRSVMLPHESPQAYVSRVLLHCLKLTSAVCFCIASSFCATVRRLQCLHAGCSSYALTASADHVPAFLSPSCCLLCGSVAPPDGVASLNRAPASKAAFTAFCSCLRSCSSYPCR